MRLSIMAFLAVLTAMVWAREAAADQPAPAAGVSEGSFQLAANARNGRVCCARGRRDWWTRSERACYRADGRVVADRRCRRDGRNRRDRDYRDDYYDDDRRGRRNRDDFYDDRRGRFDDRRGRGRLCCARGRRDWWVDSRRQCARSDGRIVSDRRCRYDGGNTRDGDPFFDGRRGRDRFDDRRGRRGRDDRGRRQVCCQRGNDNKFWTSANACYRQGGRIRDDRRCRTRNRRDARVCCTKGRREWWARTSRDCLRTGGRVAQDRKCRRRY